MYTLGLSGGFSAPDTDLVPDLVDWFFHDAAACVVKDGVLIAAAEEERFNRIKRTNKFPAHAIEACLMKAGISPAHIGAVGYYFRQDFVDQALNELYVENPTVPIRYSNDIITEEFQRQFDLELPAERLITVPHHVSHAISCFTRSGMTSALVLVMDGRGEEESGTVFEASREGLRVLATYDIAKSLGALYEYAIQVLGYRFGDEYKVMGLAPYGDPCTYAHVFRDLYSLQDNGDYSLHPKSLGAHPLAASFLANGLLPRRKGEVFSQQHKDYAAGLQIMLEDIVMHVLRYWRRAAGLTNLCFVGGVAQNSSLNGAILRSGMFREMFVHPASHDAGAAEGAALEAAQAFEGRLPIQPRLRTANFGPAPGAVEEIGRKLDAWSPLIKYQRPNDIFDTAAHLLATGAVVGWVQGSSEFGPRALGNRSILADARPAENKARINAMVKKREGYRPFAPAVTAAAAATYFDLPDTKANYDFMSFVVRVREDRRKSLGAVTHVDGTARVQVVDPASSPGFHRLVERFGQVTGTPVVLNTSFNNNAEPIVQTVEDALTCFLTTEIDYLVIEDFLVERGTSDSISLDHLILGLRPVTRLSKRSRIAPSGARETVYQVYLDYSKGACVDVSPEAYSLLEEADGRTRLDAREGTVRSLSPEITAELHRLWQARLITFTAE